MKQRDPYRPAAITPAIIPHAVPTKGAREYDHAAVLTRLVEPDWRAKNRSTIIQRESKKRVICEIVFEVRL